MDNFPLQITSPFPLILGSPSLTLIHCLTSHFSSITLRAWRGWLQERTDIDRKERALLSVFMRQEPQGTSDFRLRSQGPCRLGTRESCVVLGGGMELRLPLEMSPGEGPLVELSWEPGVFSERRTEKLPLRVDFIHRVEFGDVSGHRVLPS